MKRQRKLLLLAGTEDAHALAEQLAPDRRWHVTVAIGPMRETQASPPAEAARGGFGGAEGLMTALKWDRIDAVIDASHPFDTATSAFAATACGALGLPLIRLNRLGWTPSRHDRWHRVRSVAEAATTLPFFARALLDLDGHDLAPFKFRRDLWTLVRRMSVPLTRFPLPRGDYLVSPTVPSLGHERVVLTDYRIGWIVMGDVGGSLGETMLGAARERNLPVLMIERPPAPNLPPLTREAATAEAALSLLVGRFR
ncbi:MAG: precorrin-6A/cobalt-precorrin-6A reductase [Pseudomonadota bacterium]